MKDIEVTAPTKGFDFVLRRSNSLGGRMDLESERTFRLKEQYNSAVNELDQLLAVKRQKDAQRAEILAAIEKTDRSHEEILAFLRGETKP